ncbi:hypothetical protein DFH27DRAFT_20283 [Peziza echinospora]|nr:hypothetical protein DFH27DRAFT_20283 [Peziza echinospora]
MSFIFSLLLRPDCLARGSVRQSITRCLLSMPLVSICKVVSIEPYVTFSAKGTDVFDHILVLKTPIRQSILVLVSKEDLKEESKLGLIPTDCKYQLLHDKFRFLNFRRGESVSISGERCICTNAFSRDICFVRMIL